MIGKVLKIVASPVLSVILPGQNGESILRLLPSVPGDCGFGGNMDSQKVVWIHPFPRRAAERSAFCSRQQQNAMLGLAASACGVSAGSLQNRLGSVPTGSFPRPHAAALASLRGDQPWG